MGKGVVRERRDFAVSARVKGVVRERLDVTDNVRGKGSFGRDVILQTAKG